MSSLERMLNILDYEKASQALLEPSASDYYKSGAMDEHTLADNTDAFRRIKLLPRVLNDVSNVNISTRLATLTVDSPLIISPTAFLGMAHPDGELAVARAASASNNIMICSTMANQPIEDVTTSTQSSVWFQLYVYKDKEATLALIERAKNAGCKAIVITVDAPFLGQREQDVRNQFQLPDRLHMSNLHALGHRKLPDKTGHSGLSHYFDELINKSLTWRDIRWIKEHAGLPIYLKGILHPKDAQLAIEHGVDGIIVSNHGGRQLDTSVASIDALPAISKAVNKQIPIILDGGIRRGTDILKALALGAQCVGIGRPVIWGLSHSGQQGVEDILTILQSELKLVMALAGCASISDINAGLIADL
ncbi:MAG TPA: alpha-hydroxy-acid oxidizing protein [Cycloclasticus sp.]|nr:alpha-hydroxy-acid oxidizing protein [Cycloclasticus sp.]HIL91912.1 alpha-hydroxy-acid oxidizing protein [Cycloclasticus sp.]